MPAVFIDLPVADLDRAKAFPEALGFRIDPRFTDHNAACVVVEDDHSYFMIQTREFFQSHTDLTIGDPAENPTSGTAISLDDREAADHAVAAGVAAGGSEPQPASDHGFMDQRALTDPDGDVVDFGWMNPVAAEQGPAAFMEQQA